MSNSWRIVCRNQGWLRAALALIRDTGSRSKHYSIKSFASGLISFHSGDVNLNFPSLILAARFVF